MGPWSVISGIATVAMMPPTVDAYTRRQAIGALVLMAGDHPDIELAIRRAAASKAARVKLEALIVAMGRVLIAAREVV